MFVCRLLVAAVLFASAFGCARIDGRRAYLEGQRFEGAGRLDRAAEAYRLAAREDPSEEHRRALKRTEAALFRQHLRAAKNAEQIEDYERASDHWKQLVQMKPDDRRLAGRLRISRLRVSGSTRELWEASRELLELAPGNREVVRVVAEIQARVLEDSVEEAWVSLRAGDRDRAFLAFERVRELDPRHPDLLQTEARRLISEMLEVKADALASSGE